MEELYIYKSDIALMREGLKKQVRHIALPMDVICKGKFGDAGLLVGDVEDPPAEGLHLESVGFFNGGGWETGYGFDICQSPGGALVGRCTIAELRLQRLADMTDEDALAEGVQEDPTFCVPGHGPEYVCHHAGREYRGVSPRGTMIFAFARGMGLDPKEPALTFVVTLKEFVWL